MSFDGPALSFDDEGSILFDGEKIIVTVPVGHEALDHLGSEKEIPFPVIYTHPSHHQDQQASTPPPPRGNPVFNKEKARESVERARRARESARNKKSKSGKKDVKDNSPADRAPVTDKHDFQPDANDEESAAEAVWRENTPLTPGQQMHVDNLLSIETDSLAREVLITLKREGLPPNDRWRDFLEQYALTGWYAASDAIAWATLAKIANSEWDKTFAYADEDHVETVAQDLGDNAIEGVVVIDAKTGDTLLHLPGVVRADGSQYVGMQDTEADALLAEALSGRDLVFVHNHPNGSDASEEDLESAFRAGAELLIVITSQGQEFVYIRGKYGMVKVRDEKASYEVGPVNPEETEELSIKSDAQARAFLDDAPELIFLQSNPEVIANMDVNPDDISRYGELKDFVNTRVDELQGIGEKELLAKIGESMELLHDIFGYTFKFHEKYDVEENVRLAMAQVHNLGTILFHYLNDLGIKIMRSTHEDTQYILGADEKILKLHNVEDYTFRGHVALPESNAEGNEDLNKVYLGSKITAGAIGHEVAHEIDRREWKWSSVSEGDQPPPVGSLEWFFKHRVENRNNKKVNEYDFAQAASYLNPGSRAAREEDRGSDREIFADILPAKILGSLDEEFFSRADTGAEIGFNDTNNAKDIACGIEQYYDQYAQFLEHGTPKPKDFRFDPKLCQ